MAQFEDGSVDVIDDDWRAPQEQRRYLRRQWRGRTELEVLFTRLSQVEQTRVARLAREFVGTLG